MRDFSSFRRFSKRFAAVLAVVCAVALCAGVLSSCGTVEQQQKTPAQLNREYMSNVNRISNEAAADLADFGDAAGKGDVAAMRVAASNAQKSLEKIGQLTAPDALSGVHEQYSSGASDISQALNDYIDIYSRLKNAQGEGADTAALEAELKEVQARYDSGVKHLSEADEMVASMADEPADSEKEGLLRQS